MVQAIGDGSGVTPVTTAEGSNLDSELGVSSLLVKVFGEGKTGKDDQNLIDAWAAFIRKDYVAFKRLFLASNFYTKNNALARQRKLAFADQPGASLNDFNKYKSDTNRRLIKAGVRLSTADLDLYARQGYDNGMSDTQVDDMLITANKASNVVGGSAGGDIASLKAYANSFGVGTMQNWNANSQALFAGTMTVEEIQEKIRKDAVGNYPAYASQFDKGVTLDAIASGYKSIYASVMEKDSDSVSYEDPIMQKALQWKNAKGESEAMPAWLFKQELKKLPEWAMTDNARDSLDSKTSRVLSDMGLV